MPQTGKEHMSACDNDNRYTGKEGHACKRECV